MYVILDTNILRTDFLFKSVQYNFFSEFIKRTRSTLILPKIIFEEICHLYNIELEVKQNTLKKSLLDISRFCDTKIDIEYYQKQVLKDLNFNYEKCLNDIFFYNLEIIGYETIDINELARRAVYRIKPFSKKGNEFRDTLAWLSILEFLKKRSNDKYVFITNDLKAFAGDDYKSLHPTLQNDLATNNLQLAFCNSIESFMKDYASEIMCFTKKWVSDHIDWNEIIKQIREAVETIHCGYFFTLYERSTNAPWDYNYEVKEVEINRNWLEYYIYENTDKTFVLELHFSGIAMVDFFLNNGSLRTLSTEFVTETTAICTKDKILEYSGNYYEEESGLCFPPLSIANK